MVNFTKIRDQQFSKNVSLQVGKKLLNAMREVDLNRSDQTIATENLKRNSNPSVMAANKNFGFTFAKQ